MSRNSDKEGIKMDNAIMRGLAGMLVLGVIFWGPGVPRALALDAEMVNQCRETIAGDPTIDPAVREIALNEVVPNLEAASRADASPEARTEERIVTTTALVIRDTTETTKKALENPDAVTKTAIEALIKGGVPAEVASKVEGKMKDALAKANEALQRGGTVEDAVKYFEICRSAMSEVSSYLGGKDFKEVFAAGGPSGEFRSTEFVGAVIDPSQRDVMEAAMKAHFEAALRTTDGGISSREIMERMMVAGVNPNEVFREMGPAGGMGMDAGRFSGPSPEAIAAMSPEQKAGYEAWKSGDFAAVHEMMMNDTLRAAAEAGTPAPREMMYREMVTPSMMEATQDRIASQTQVAADRYADGHLLCPPGKTHVGGVADGDPAHCI